jgi:hypothetical protein
VRTRDEERIVIRHNLSVVLTATAVVILLLVAFLLALTQHKLSELGLDLVVYLFAITLGVFVIERMLAWREERRWLAAKNWLYMILLETVDDLLKELLPPTVPSVRDLDGDDQGDDEGDDKDLDLEGSQITLYELTGERIHFGEAVAYSPLELRVGTDEKDLQSYILFHADRLGAQRYADLARSALSDAREQVRDVFGSSARLMEADLTTMLISFEQAALAAIRHLDSATSLRDRKLEEGTYLDGGGDGGGGGEQQSEQRSEQRSEQESEQESEQRVREADKELAFVSSIIVESVVNLAMKPKGWLEREMYGREGPSPFGALQASSGNRVGMGSTKRTGA